MTLHLDLATHATVAAVRRLLESTSTPSRSEAYAHLGRRLRRFAFWKRYKAGKGVLRACLQRTTKSCTRRSCVGSRPT